VEKIIYFSADFYLSKVSEFFKRTELIYRFDIFNLDLPADALKEFGLLCYDVNGLALET